MIPYSTQESEFKITPEGTFPAIISEAEIYNNPSGQDKIIVRFSYENPETKDTAKHSEFVNPAIMVIGEKQSPIGICC